MGVITIKFDPSFLRLLPTNENSIISVCPSIQMSMLAIINLHSHLEDHMSWIIGTTKVLLKNTLISPHPQMPARYHENSLPLSVV
jgi:hypothetical protein